MDSLNNKQTNRISVLMAIYNCAGTLSEALDSLLAQTYQGFQVILCDDCSTDNTYSIAQSYVQKYPGRFILIKNEVNSKLPFSLNHCLQYADTEYVARMDGDDLSKPNRFEREIEFLDSHPEFDIVSCPMEYFDENGVFMTGRMEEHPDKTNFIGATPHAHAPAMLRTEALRSVGGYTVRSWTRRGQDVHLWAKLYSTGHIGANLMEPLYMMRDDRAAYKRRTLKEAFYAIRRNYEIYKLMDIEKLKYFSILRPLFVALAPKFVYDYFHRNNISSK